MQTTVLKGEKRIKKRADIETPLSLCNWIARVCEKELYFKSDKVILDPCSANGNLTKPFPEAKVIEYEIKKGKDFLKAEGKIDVDLVLCNPPFNGHPQRLLYPELFLEKIIEVIKEPFETPIVFFSGVNLYCNQEKKSSRWRKLRELQFKSAQFLFLPRDIFQNVNTWCMISFFNFRTKIPFFLPDIAIKQEQGSLFK